MWVHSDDYLLLNLSYESLSTMSRNLNHLQTASHHKGGMCRKYLGSFILAFYQCFSWKLPFFLPGYLMMRDASCIDEMYIFMHWLEILPLNKATFAPQASMCVWLWAVCLVSGGAFRWDYEPSFSGRLFSRLVIVEPVLPVRHNFMLLTTI